MHIHKATSADLELITQSRIDFLSGFRTINSETEKKLRKELLTYFAEAFVSNEILAMYGTEDGQVLATAIMSVHRRPPSDRLLHGMYGRLTNIYVYPEHRGKGYASRLLGELLQAAKDMDIDSVELSATDDGMALYRRMGFGPGDGTFLWKKL